MTTKLQKAMESIFVKKGHKETGAPQITIKYNFWEIPKLVFWVKYPFISCMTNLDKFRHRKLLLGPPSLIKFASIADGVSYFNERYEIEKKEFGLPNLVWKEKFKPVPEVLYDVDGNKHEGFVVWVDFTDDNTKASVRIGTNETGYKTIIIHVFV